MKNLSVTLLVFLVSSFHYCLFSQDTVRVMRPNNPPEFMRPSVRIDSTYPPITCSSFEDGKKAALRDISKNRIRVQMKDQRWCIWHDHLDDWLEKEYAAKVSWKYEQKERDFFDEGPNCRGGYSDGYFATMDSVLNQRIPDSELIKQINVLQKKYDPSEKSCPDIYYLVDEFAKPQFDMDLFNKELTEKATTIVSEIAGKVVVHLIILSDGSVLKADIIRGIHTEIDEMVSNALLLSKFTPCLKDGESVSCSRSYVTTLY